MPRISDKTESQHRTNGRRVGHANNIESNTFSSIGSSSKSTSPSQSLCTTMPVWHQHQQPQRTLQSFRSPSSASSIDDFPYYRFCLAANHPKTQCHSISLQLWFTLINTHEVSLPSISRRPRWPFPNTYRCYSPPTEGNSTSNTLRSMNYLDWQPPP